MVLYTDQAKRLTPLRDILSASCIRGFIAVGSPPLQICTTVPDGGVAGYNQQASLAPAVLGRVVSPALHPLSQVHAPTATAIAASPFLNSFLVELQTTNLSASAPKPGNAHKCRTCSKTFKRSEHCARHELAHTKQRPFSCNFCHKAYARK